jgi:Protein of unknown function (DUF3605)
VHRTFVDRVRDLGGEKGELHWFENWTALQSVPELEHLHVLTRDIPEENVLEWTSREGMMQGKVWFTRRSIVSCFE